MYVVRGLKVWTASLREEVTLKLFDNIAERTVLTWEGGSKTERRKLA
jgi:hypothetical protein